MNDGERKPENPAKARVRHYADILNPLFWDDDFNNNERLFELACTLVRASGMKDVGWESYYESTAFLKDMQQLGEIDLPPDRFPEPGHTRARLALLSYAHLVEMNLPYELLANLLRLRMGLKYSIHPFSHLAEPIKKNKVIVGWKTPSPEKKIKQIEEYSSKAGMPAVGVALRSIYDATIRNAVFHSDYVLHGGSLRLLSSTRFSKKKNLSTPVVEFDELVELTADAFGFHSALDLLYRRDVTLFTDFRERFMPFDLPLKGIIEYTFDGDAMQGFRVYWPNQQLSEYRRAADGQCTSVNLAYNEDGSINFFVGLYASKPGTFSPLVEDGAQPSYAHVPGTTLSPYWPNPLNAYKL